MTASYSRSGRRIYAKSYRIYQRYKTIPFFHLLLKRKPKQAVQTRNSFVPARALDGAVFGKCLVYGEVEV